MSGILNQHIQGAGCLFEGQPQVNGQLLRRMTRLQRRINFYEWFTWTLGSRWLKYFAIFPYPQMYRDRLQLHILLQKSKVRTWSLNANARTFTNAPYESVFAQLQARRTMP